MLNDFKGRKRQICHDAWSRLRKDSYLPAKLQNAYDSWEDKRILQEILGPYYEPTAVRPAERNFAKTQISRQRRSRACWLAFQAGIKLSTFVHSWRSWWTRKDNRCIVQWVKRAHGPIQTIKTESASVQRNFLTLWVWDRRKSSLHPKWRMDGVFGSSRVCFRSKNAQ